MLSLYPLLQQSWKGFTFSFCPSVCPRTESCLLCIFHSTSQIHFIFTHLTNHLQKVCFMLLFLYPPPRNEVERWVYWFHGVRLSVRPSICLWTESCPLCKFHNTSQIHFIFTCLFKQLQKVRCVLVVLVFVNSKIWNFGNLFYFRLLDPLYDLCLSHMTTSWPWPWNVCIFQRFLVSLI